MSEQEQSSTSSPEEKPEPQTTEQRRTEQQRKMQHLLVRAMKDEAWRQELLTNPKPLIERELGITIPPGVTIAIHEVTPTTIHLMLPPRQLQAAEVSDADLAAAAAAVGVPAMTEPCPTFFCTPSC